MSKPLSVLIVDDHEAMRALLRKVLERAGVNDVRDAQSGAAGLAMLSERAADLVLADYRMPGMEGPAFVEAARAQGSQARVLMITGHAGQTRIDAAMAAGADGVLLKPVSPRDLLAAIEKLFAD